MKKIIIAITTVLCICLLSGAKFTSDERVLSDRNPQNQAINEELEADAALDVINGLEMVKYGLTGKGVKIGVIDLGFHKANETPYLKHIFKNNQVSSTFDFLDPEDEDIYDENTKMDWHGTLVWKYIGGKDEQKKKVYGVATDATYYLARTDDGEKEYQKEMEYFAEALKWFHEQGVRLIHTSLGYSYGFDDPGENLIPEDMNGKTALISKAVEKAIKDYNMIVVTSAGNEGDNVWKIISAPADVENIISVGSIEKNLIKHRASSVGPEFLSYLKPDVSCYNPEGGGGTSFSAPIVTGLIACMLQKSPELTAKEIKSILQKSGHIYPFGNNYVGYGMPDAKKIIKLLEDRDATFNQTTELESAGKKVKIALNGAKSCVLYHKMNKWVVLKEERLELTSGSLKVKRPKPISRSNLIVEDKVQGKYYVKETMEEVGVTTVLLDDRIVEISWK